MISTLCNTTKSRFFKKSHLAEVNAVNGSFCGQARLRFAQVFFCFSHWPALRRCLRFPRKSNQLAHRGSAASTTMTLVNRWATRQFAQAPSVNPSLKMLATTANILPSQLRSRQETQHATIPGTCGECAMDRLRWGLYGNSCAEGRRGALGPAFGEFIEYFHSL